MKAMKLDELIRDLTEIKNSLAVDADAKVVIVGAGAEGLVVLGQVEGVRAEQSKVVISLAPDFKIAKLSAVRGPR